MIRQMTAVLFGAAMLAAAGAAAGEAAPHGIWLTEKGKVAVRLHDCESGLCGQIVWMAEPHDKTGALRRDTRNPDAARRDRAWCGMAVISGLRPGPDGTWSGGRFYYPKHGRSYDLTLRPVGNGLEVHAYAGLRMLGVTEAWRRLDAAPGECPADVDRRAGG